RLSTVERQSFLEQSPESAAIIKAFYIGRDIANSPRGEFVIDTFGLTEQELKTKYPGAFERLLTRVKPERDQNKRDTRRDNWWLFGENAPKMRRALAGLTRFIATIETSKFKPF